MHGTMVLLAERCAVTFSLKLSHVLFCMLMGSRRRVIHACNPLTCFQAAETLLERDGDFLVRDSSSSPRDYVLTCFWMNGPMHFKIIRVVLRPKMVRPCYRVQLVSLFLSSRTLVSPNDSKKQSLKYYWIVAPNGSSRWAIQDFINIQWGADFNIDVQIHWSKTSLLAGRFWKHLSQLLSSWFGGLWCISCLPSFACQGHSKELFQFEKDRFDNVPALIRFYVGGRQPISQASGAVIFHPITRTLPLRVIIEQQAGSDKQAKSSKRRSLSTAHADMLQIINPLLRSDEACRNAGTQYK